uniref:Coiled-coil and C2 domain-containing protein 1A-like n=1 Tax=Phallusia mammillata TaxID=59560 RepID=A0A6F9D8L6_9ASCI|nr:coiled-coil and C2 domain-containing protein 1A-like [Phallusia mammillata]
MPKGKERPPPKKGRKNVLNMMGYDEGVESDDDDMEAQLAALLGEGGSTTAKKKPAPKLLDWSIIDAQVASSMRDVDEEDDDEVTEEDENELMSELTDLVGDDEPALLQPAQARGRSRSPSPQPQAGSSTVELLTSRKTMYQTAVKTAQKDGQTSKVRRLQRGIKTIDDLLKLAKKGKPISEDDIPPMVAGAVNPPTSTPAVVETEPIKPKDPPPSIAPKPVVKKAPTKVQQAEADPKILQILERRKQEYKVAALQAKRDGDKTAALGYFKVIKQFDAAIQNANEGQTVDISKMPTSLKDKPVINAQPPQPVVQPVSQLKNEDPAQTQEPEVQQPNVPTVPKTALEALEQRMQKYQSSAADATKEGNGGKARRMGRIVKQYQTAIRSHKAGKPVNFDELPVPPGFPPIPGVKETQQENLLQKAESLIQQNVEEEEPGPSKPAPNQLPVPVAAGRSKSPQSQKGSKSPSPTPTKGAPKTPYDQQVAFLQNRQAAFKRAALEAKKKGDKATALEYLRQMKGFDEMIQAAKSGLKVDITNVPQPPVEHSRSSHGDEGFEVIESHEISKSTRKSTPEEDDELYSKLSKMLQKQVEKARAFAQQMTHTGDVAGAERCDRLAGTSQADYDYVRSCRRHGDPPPHFYYEDKSFNTVKIIPDLGSNEMELELVQCMDLNTGGKEAKIFIEWEFPFPHDNPCKGKSEEGQGTKNLKFNEHFRVPFIRKLKASHRAVKNKSLKLEVFQKGGFLRSDKSFGSVTVKLAPLEAHCEIHAVEEIKDGRNTVGKIEAYIRLRTPLLGSDVSTTKEKWLHIEHRKRHHSPPASTSKSSSKQISPKPSGSSRKPVVNISSMEVLRLDMKIVDTKMGKFKQRGERTPTDLQREMIALKKKHDETKKFLEEGAQHARKEYAMCLAAQYQHLGAEAQSYARQGKKEQAKLALTKKSFVQKELEKYNT